MIKTYGNILLINDDCMPYMANCKDKCFDIGIVDPPYGLGESVVNSGGRFKRYHNKNGNWDMEVPTIEYFNELKRISENQIIWGGNYFMLQPNKCFIIWDKMQPEGISFAMCEYAWSSFDSVAKIFRCRTQDQIQRFHPTQKPVSLYRWLIKNYCKPNDKIFDSHGGSMSIAIAVHEANVLDNMNLSLVVCEKDKDYYTDAVNRFENFLKQPLMKFPEHEIKQIELF